MNVRNSVLLIFLTWAWAVASPSLCSGGEVKLTVYYSNRTAVVGEPFPIVLEIKNDTNRKQTVFADLTWMERENRLPEGAQFAPDASKSTSESEMGDKPHLVIRSLIPVGEEKKHVASPKVAVDRNLVEIAPGRSVLLKIELPPECFGVGECSLEMMIRKGKEDIARSASVTITGVRKKVEKTPEQK